MTRAWGADLKEIKAKGELCHLGIRYANFVTGAGDGFDVEIVQGFARYIACFLRQPSLRRIKEFNRNPVLPDRVAVRQRYF